jgi:hypothetical protein
VQPETEIRAPDGYRAGADLVSHLADGAKLLSVDAPSDPNGVWWFDLSVAGVTTEVAWRPTYGYGIFTSDDVGYGQGPDEVFADAAEAAARLLLVAASLTPTQA